MNDFSKRTTRFASLALALGLLLAVTSLGCAQLKPWEREIHARQDMAWDPNGLEAQRRGHVYFAKEAAMSGGGGGGGGCGCN